MSPTHPPLDVLRHVVEAAQNFLRRLADANLLEGVPGGPLDRNTSIHRGTAAFRALVELEHALNPRRLPFNHDQRRVIIARGYPESLLTEITGAFSTVRDGHDAVLALWKVEGLCGAESYTMGGTLLPGCQHRPGHVHFDIPADWPPPLPESVAAPFAAAVDRLTALVSLIEAWESGTAPLASMQAAPGRVVEVTGLSCKLVAGTQPTVCPSADPVVPHSQLRRVEEVIRAACRLPEGVMVHWVGHETGARNGCSCHLTPRTRPRSIGRAWSTCSSHWNTPRATPQRQRQTRSPLLRRTGFRTPGMLPGKPGDRSTPRSSKS